MNNYCRNCGVKLENNIEICPKCNAKVFETRVNVYEKEQQLEEYKMKEKKYIILVLTLFSLSFILTHLNAIIKDDISLFSSVSPLLFLGGIITLIYARVTMNESKKIKIMYNIFITFVVLYFLFILSMLITCVNAFNRGCY